MVVAVAREQGTALQFRKPRGVHVHFVHTRLHCACIIKGGRGKGKRVNTMNSTSQRRYVQYVLKKTYRIHIQMFWKYVKSRKMSIKEDLKRRLWHLRS